MNPAPASRSYLFVPGDGSPPTVPRPWAPALDGRPVVLHGVQFRREYTRANPAVRYGLPEEIASAVAYLASEEAGYVNGVVLPVDGGFMASGARPEAASEMNARTGRDPA